MTGIERTAPLRISIDALGDVLPVDTELGERFAAMGFELALVGGSVRDAMLGRLGNDLDFTTNAVPDDILRIVRGWADSIWEVGIRFGTVGAVKDGYQLEITTYRAESYEQDSRKPSVQFGDTLAEDLVRRDFTINAMAITLPTVQFVDLHNGVTDLAAGVIRTPGTPEQSFGDDPLRMMRAARFASQLEFTVDSAAVAAMTEMAERLEIVSPERIRDELSRLLLGDDPRGGLQLLVDTGLTQYVLPELPALALEIDEHHRHKDVYEHSLIVLEQAIDLETTHEPMTNPDLVLRLAALLHDIGKPKTRRFETNGGVSFHHHEVVGAKLTRKRLKALRYPNEIIDHVSKLVELHLRFHGYSSGQWTDAAVRRYVRDAGDELTRLHKLTRADSTTRNQRKAAALQASYDSLEARIAVLSEEEEMKAVRPDLDGQQIMAILGISPGREVGVAYKYLLERRLDRGPVDEATAEAELREWWDQRSQ
ncbi:MAG: CCA tRNA nucleotidyltransferase [Actinobacteria bacterium]|nr:CCA tRNA nucleotidyltransferase [Actinomycetota bacterium]